MSFTMLALSKQSHIFKNENPNGGGNLWFFLKHLKFYANIENDIYKSVSWLLMKKLKQK